MVITLLYGEMGEMFVLTVVAAMRVRERRSPIGYPFPAKLVVIAVRDDATYVFTLACGEERFREAFGRVLLIRPFCILRSLEPVEIYNVSICCRTL